MKLKLPIFFNTDETTTLKESGIDYEIEENDIRFVVFYHIDAIAPHLKDGRKYTTVYSCGDCFICNKPISEIEEMIDRAIHHESIMC